MWLLNARTKKLEQAVDEWTKPYAILSHTWQDNEVTFQDILYDSGNAKRKNGYQKIDCACQQALKDGIDYVWVDTCCIDKSSSAELSEAINSMFNYYKQAVSCYTFLFDAEGYYIARCRWFTRGWTLQELLAPSQVKFFGPGWHFIGTRYDLVETIEDVTRIDRDALLQTRMLSEYSVATRLSWAADRQTSRVEDRAYSLLGIFDVHMPLIYGEGNKAFRRLQKEIITMSTDQSIFVWKPSPLQRHQLLADDPDDFKYSSQVIGWHEPGNEFSYHLSNGGLEIRLPIIQDERGYSYGILRCRAKHIFTGPLALPLSPRSPDALLSTMRGNSLAFHVERYPNSTFEHENLIDGELGLFGLSYIPLEMVNQARLTSMTILNDKPSITGMAQRGSASRRAACAKVWVRTEALDQGEHFKSKVYPGGLWSSSSTFDSTKADAHSGIKLWLLQDGYFVLAFRLCRASAETGTLPEGLHMVIARPKALACTPTAPGTWRHILDTLLEHTEPTTEVSAHFHGWRDVKAQATLGERMGEQVYTIHVTMTRPSSSVTLDASTSLVPRKRRRS